MDEDLKGLFVSGGVTKDKVKFMISLSVIEVSMVLQACTGGSVRDRRTTSIVIKVVQ